MIIFNTRQAIYKHYFSTLYHFVSMAEQKINILKVLQFHNVTFSLQIYELEVTIFNFAYKMHTVGRYI